MNELYVSLNGNDCAEGSISNPLRTLEEARDRIRKMEDRQQGVVVNIRGGEYPVLDKPFIIGREDSGTENGEIIYRAYGDEKVTLIGSITLSGEKFQKITDEKILARLRESVRDQVLVCNLAAETGIAHFAPIGKTGWGWPDQAAALSVMVNGKAMKLPRYPKEEFLTVSEVEDTGFIPREHLRAWTGVCEECSEEAGERSQCKYEEEEFIRQKGGVCVIDDETVKEKCSLWRTENDLWVKGYFCWAWADDSCPVSKVEETEQGLRFTTKNPSRYGFGKSKTQPVPYMPRVYFSNLFCELDTPGEWYLDRKEGKLYLYPETELTDAVVEVTIQTAPLVIMEDVSHVRLENISFGKSNGHGIRMIRCENTEIAGCSFFDLGQRAIYMGDPAKIERREINTGYDGGRNNTVRSCNITRTGQGGIFVGGGNRYTLTHCNNQVVNCEISDYSVTKRTYAAAIELSGCGSIARRNKIYNAPHLAILFQGNDMLIEGNEIYDVCYETEDVGAIYTGRKWTWRGSVIRNNYIHDFQERGGLGSAGIYLDDVACGTVMTENLFVNLPGYTFLVGGGRDNTITNNIQLNNGKNGRGIHFDTRGMNWAKMFATAPDGECYAEWMMLQSQPEFDRKVWEKAYPELFAMKLPESGEGYCEEAAKMAGAVIERNILVGVAEPFGNMDPLVAELGSVKDNESCAYGEEIGFADVENRDYSVRPDSKICRMMGEKYFRMENTGLYEDNYRMN